MQLMTTGDTATTEAAYLAVIQAKTAELFAAASRIGAVLAERPGEEEAALDCFGRNLGIAFQLVDDMLDFSAREAELGKSVGDDFRDGKVTLPILLAFARGDDEERAFWQRTLETMDQQPGDLERAILLVERRDALAETAGARPQLRRRRDRCAGAVSRRPGAPRPDRRRRLLRRPQLLTDAVAGSDARPDRCLAHPRRWRYRPDPVGGV